MRRPIRYAAWAALLGALTALLLVGKGHFPPRAALLGADTAAHASSAKVVPSKAPTRRPVSASREERQSLHETIVRPGQIEGCEQTPLYARLSGYVQKVQADLGDRVEQGQVLAELAIPELREEARQKEAAVGLAKAELAHARRALRAAEARLQKAEAAIPYARAGRTRAESNLARWQAEYSRVRKLITSRAIEAQTYDATVDQLKSAESARDESETGIHLAESARDESSALRDEAQAAIEVAEAKLRVAEADARRVAALLQYAQIRAPFSGVVTRRNVDTGHFVQPAAGGAGTPLFVVVRTDPLRLFVDVPETAAARVRPGMPAHVRVPALGNEEFEGRVSRSSWGLNSQTRALRTQIDLPNPEGRLRPGMGASALLTVERPGPRTLSAAAVP